MTQVESENKYVFIRTSANFYTQTQFQNLIKNKSVINFTCAIIAFKQSFIIKSKIKG